MNTNELSFRVAMDGIASDILDAYREASLLEQGKSAEARLYAERIHGSLERALEKLAPMGIHTNATWDRARHRTH